MKYFLTFVFIFNLSAETPSAVFTKRCDELIGQKDKVTEAKRLHAVFKADWEYSMTEFPESATWRGHPGQNNRWTDYSLETVGQRQQDTLKALAVIKSIERGKLSAADQLNFDLFLRSLLVAKAGNEFPQHLLLINQMDGLQRNVASMLRMMPARKVSDFEDILARMRGTEKLVQQTIDLLEVGLKMSVTPPKICLRNLGEQVTKQLTDDPMNSPLLRPFQNFPPSIREPNTASH